MSSVLVFIGALIGAALVAAVRGHVGLVVAALIVGALIGVGSYLSVMSYADLMTAEQYSEHVISASAVGMMIATAPGSIIALGVLTRRARGPKRRGS